MRSVSRDEEVIAAGQRERLTCDLKSRFTAQQQNPFVLGLIVEDWLRLAAADDALDAQVSTTQQLFEDLTGRWCWLVSEQVTALDQARN